MESETGRRSEINQMLIALRRRSRSNNHFHRASLVKMINGDIFYPFKSWPTGYKTLFFKSPLKDAETFRLLLFLTGMYYKS